MQHLANVNEEFHSYLGVEHLYPDALTADLHRPQ